MADFLDAIAHRSTAEHIAWMMYEGRYSFTHGRVRADHAEVERLLDSAHMHIALMQLELAMGVRNLRQTLTPRKSFLRAKPATEWMEEQLERARLQRQALVFGELPSTRPSHRDTAPNLSGPHRMALQSTDFISSVRDTSRSRSSATLRINGRGKAVPLYCFGHPNWSQNASQPTMGASANREEQMEDVIYH